MSNRASATTTWASPFSGQLSSDQSPCSENRGSPALISISPDSRAAVDARHRALLVAAGPHPVELVDVDETGMYETATLNMSADEFAIEVPEAENDDETQEMDLDGGTVDTKAI